MRILILVEAYPREGSSISAFVHTRVKNYLKSGFDVSVLSFSTPASYRYEGVLVQSKNDLKDIESYDVVVAHAPNVRNHFRYIFLHLKRIKSLVLCIHGHEVLRRSRYYPRPYSFQKRSKLLDGIRCGYDFVKCILLKTFFKRLMQKKNAKIVFVSNWMYEQTKTSLNMSDDDFFGQYCIIPNPVNEVFVNSSYIPESEIDADFITIRAPDIPKYGVDLLVRTCIRHPQYTFALYGNGNYFKYNVKPDNLKHYNFSLKQGEILKVLKKYRYAFMPTKLDAQGVMACEIAVTGMRLVSSAHDGCIEFLKDLKNVAFVNNDDIDLDKAIVSLEESVPEDLVRKLHPTEITKVETELFMASQLKVVP